MLCTVAKYMYIMLKCYLAGKKATQTPKQEKSAASVVESIQQFCRSMPVKVEKLLKVRQAVRTDVLLSDLNCLVVIYP